MIKRNKIKMVEIKMFSLRNVNTCIIKIFKAFKRLSKKDIGSGFNKVVMPQVGNSNLRDTWCS